MTKIPLPFFSYDSVGDTHLTESNRSEATTNHDAKDATTWDLAEASSEGSRPCGVERRGMEHGSQEVAHHAY
jgi:hypothetical protein